MAAMPSSQAGWRASRTMSRASNPAAGPVFRAPARWHTDAVAVHRLAAIASKIAFSMYFSVSAAPGRANGAIRRFPVGLPPGSPGMRAPRSLVNRLTAAGIVDTYPPDCAGTGPQSGPGPARGPTAGRLRTGRAAGTMRARFPIRFRLRAASAGLR